jgi:hypothetical protein
MAQKLSLNFLLSLPPGEKVVVGKKWLADFLPNAMHKRLYFCLVKSSPGIFFEVTICGFNDS